MGSNLCDQNNGEQAARDDAALTKLHGRPGFLLRRALQLSTSIFLKHCGPITTTQYGVIVVLSKHDGLSQRELGDLLFLDRTTTALAVKILEQKKMVARTRDASDARRMVLSLTETARLALPDLFSCAESAQTDLLMRLSLEERLALRRILEKLIDGQSGEGVP
ncbi:MarR family transcriptional regulator [Rhizobium rhizogenes]|uniref:MarR family transcriptional regulator n=1 Tax=Rhizobium rhizogenes TaxID=359 RepID=A0A546X3T3_RHIRH|nr:MarR family transcriptional regulator [Rhizobium rhizogenes]